MKSSTETNNWSRYYHILAALLILFFLILFYRDVVFAGRTFLMETAAVGTMPMLGPFKYQGVTPGFVADDPSAISLQIEPFNRFLSKSLKRGDFPLWNPYAGVAGSPLLADGHTGPLEPLQFLFFFVPDRYWTYAVDVQLLLRFFLAGFFCYLFARRLNLGFWGSVTAGVLFMLSRYLVTFGNHPQIKTEMLLPLVLYGFDRLTDSKDRQGFWLCALFIGWAIIAAMPESTFFALFLGTLWYFYKSIFIQTENNDILKKVRLTSTRYIGSALLGVLISAVYLLPFLEYVSLAASVHSTGNEINWGGQVEPLWSIFSMILPVMKRKSFLQFGIFALFVLVFSFFSFKDKSKFRPVIIFFGTYAAFFILTVFNFPLTAWIQRMPVFDRIVLAKYPVLSIAFCLALLAGIFVDETYTRLSYKNVSIALFVLPLLCLVLPRLYDPQSFLSNLPDKQGIYIVLYFLAGISFALYFLTFLIKTTHLKSYTLQIALLLLLLVEPFYWGAQMERPDRYDPYFQHIPPFIRYLKDDNEIYRIFSLDRILFPNISTAYGIFDIRWINALIPQRAYDFSARFLQPKEPSTMRFTGSALPVSDKMFNLLDVKYILAQNSSMKEGTNGCPSTTVPQPYFGRDTLRQLIVKQNQGKKNFFTQLSMTIDGATRTSIFAHPPGEFDLAISVPEQSPSLDFSIGLDPQVFQPDRGDGVEFTIKVIDNMNNRSTLFAKYIDPKNHPCDRKWFDESVPLDPWAGKNITLRFITDAGPMGNINWDWAYWGDIGWGFVPTSQSSKVSPPVTLELSYETVHRDFNVEIFKNKDVYPRAFMVYDIMKASGFNQALDLLSDPDIDLRQTAIVENFPNNLRTLIKKSDQQVSSGLADVERITPDRLSIKVEIDSPGLLVVSEQYYPGWRAYVDGKETHVYAVDGILRGVFLSKGKHTVIFEYKPLSFLIGLIVSTISLLVALARLAYLYKRSTQPEMVSDLRRPFTET